MESVITIKIGDLSRVIELFSFFQFFNSLSVKAFFSLQLNKIKVEINKRNVYLI